MLQFKKIEIDDIDIYKKYYEKNPEFSCENSFVNLIIWQSAYNNMMAVDGDYLFIKSGDKESTSFRLPFGGDMEKGMKLLRDYCKGEKPKIWAQDGIRLDEFRKICGEEYSFREHRDAFDYVYLRENLAELSGKKYHSKRNHISAFSKKFSWEYRPITNENKDAAKQCCEKWYSENSERLDKYMLCEKNGIDIMLDNMEKLRVKGGAIYVEGLIVALTLGSPINSRVFDIHVEKALKDYAEAYTVINREFAKNELADFEYINREDDMGLEGLRKAKLSYKPDHLIKKYSCR